MAHGLGDLRLDLFGALDPYALQAHRFGHRCEIWVHKISAEIKEAGGLLLQLDKTERAIIEDHQLHRQFELNES